mgnify:FL=1
MSMSENRKVAFEIVYSLENQDTKYEDYKENINMVLEERNIHGKATTKYIKDVVYGTKRHGKQIKKQIENCLSEKWSYDRISKVDIAILEIAIFEILFLKIPFKVSINEAVEMAKMFGDTKSPAFINGVLATVVKNNGVTEDNDSKVENANNN